MDGPQGIAGPKGEPGERGMPGRDGARGETGPPGESVVCASTSADSFQLKRICNQKFAIF